MKLFSKLGKLTSFIIFMVGLLCLGFPSVCAEDSYKVSIEKAPPVVRNRFFDFRNPPTDLPPLNPGEKGITQAVFDLVVRFDIEVVSKEKTESTYIVVMRPKSTSVKLSLPITIWIPKGAPKKFIKHEQGHNFINQQIYEDADKVVRFFAMSMGNAQYRGEGNSYDQALLFAYQQAGEELNSLYRRYVHGYSMCVSEEYDKLTQHGLNSYPEEEAIEQSFFNCADYAEEFNDIRDYFKQVKEKPGRSKNQ